MTLTPLSDLTKQSIDKVDPNSKVSLSTLIGDDGQVERDFNKHKNSAVRNFSPERVIELNHEVDIESPVKAQV